MIYVVGRADDDWRKHPIKIGYTASKSAKRRLQEIQVGNPHKLRVILVVPGEMAEEQTCHYVLRNACMSGEWFDPSKMKEDTLDDIDNGTLRFLWLESMELAKQFMGKESTLSIPEDRYSRAPPAPKDYELSRIEVESVMDVYAQMGHVEQKQPTPQKTPIQKKRTTQPPPSNKPQQLSLL